MKELKDSAIVNISLQALFPLIVLFSFQLFSYGAAFPGGGFQAGVTFGTIVVVLEVVRGARIYDNDVYVGMELAGVMVLLLFLFAGLILSGKPFGGFYGLQTAGLLFSSVYIWLLNLAIYLEVAGSIVLVFRYFIEWEHESLAA